MEIRINPVYPDFHTFLCKFFSFLNACISVKTSPINTILGDPGAVSGDGEKSKTGEKKFGRRKVKNEEKSPWGQCFNGPVPNGQASSGF